MLATLSVIGVIGITVGGGFLFIKSLPNCIRCNSSCPNDNIRNDPFCHGEVFNTSSTSSIMFIIFLNSFIVLTCCIISFYFGKRLKKWYRAKRENSQPLGVEAGLNRVAINDSRVGANDEVDESHPLGQEMRNLGSKIIGLEREKEEDPREQQIIKLQDRITQLESQLSNQQSQQTQTPKIN